MAAMPAQIACRTDQGRLEPALVSPRQSVEGLDLTAAVRSAQGHSRRFDGRLATSGLPPSTDIVRTAWQVRFVPLSDSCTAAKAPTGITSSACAGDAAHWLSRRGGAGGAPRRPRRGACAHHRVERADRGARHEARSTRSRATISADRRHGERLTATKCGKAAQPLQSSDRGLRRGPLFRGSQQRLSHARGLELMRPGHTLRCYPYHFAIVSRSAATCV